MKKTIIVVSTCLLILGIYGCSGVPAENNQAATIEYLENHAISGTSEFPIFSIGQYSNAIFIIASDDGSVIVNPNADRIAIMSPKWEVERMIGGTGSGPGEFRRPMDVTIQAD